ncbi:MULTISPECIES: ABC transporter ATP-binding protein [Bacillus]|uniref:ABC transporter ATP-binding protein n=1 Tax=Bacillus TaxID=1386 RepID=UPI00046FE6C7|nr:MULTISPECIES: ABC transporter ATP-binding protein [Bacillus]HCX49608.1 ABC transporter ATP-binding protein [Bacillus sp. (in: firmicutes)]ARO59356.1 Putative multidrug resistance ABC transporter ATP-binding/permease protein YheH [Bacillus cereus]ARO65925.1 Putative multidrug resistance ABC transporter ATP-binding/permease protein YheH [Bacillus cereus]ASI81888.1 Lipid A export ATP-binding/permease protein MsbA [Bacillus cereus]AVR30686.1 Lipid A export ATP-binding/permease protein MsbA [Bac
MSVSKRLFQYAMKVKGTIFAAMLMLFIFVIAELAGPFVAKTMIDDHIVGIEKPWYETEQSEEAVSYNGAFYKRSDRFEQGETKGKEVRVMQVGFQYYFVPNKVNAEGSRTVKGDMITVQNGKAVQVYKAKALTKEEVFAFYKPEINRLLLLGGGYFTLLVVVSLFAYGKQFFLQKAANKIIQIMREDVFSHIQTLPIRYFDHLPAGKIVSRVTNDTEAIRDLYVTVLATFVSSIIYIIGIFAALFLLDVKLASLCLLIIPILIVWAILYRKYASVYNHKMRSRLSDINGTVNESIQGMPIIQAFRQERETKKEFEELNGDYFKYQNKILNLNAATSHNLVAVLRNIAFTGVIWYFGGASLSATGIISLGVLYAFVDYLTRLFSPITNMVNQLANLEQARVASERVFELLEEKGEPVEEERMPRLKGNVKFDNVSFSYNGKDEVLKNISFEAKQGETVALVGHTGSGKSSIMNVLFQFYEFEKGKLTIDGHDVKEMPKQATREHMGIVLQDPFLFSGTVASNVSLENEKISKERIVKALRDVGAERFANNINEEITEKGSTLSTGERQLISFARALAFDPAILILDEATSSIDTETEAMIQQALEVVKKGRTTFIIAHRLSTIKSADQIIVLDRGTILEKGSHDELMKKRGRYYDMYKTQMEGNQSA